MLIGPDEWHNGYLNSFRYTFMAQQISFELQGYEFASGLICIMAFREQQVENKLQFASTKK